MSELLPCPFCGSTNIDPEEWRSTDGSGPGCDDCGACAETAAIWNTRALTAAPTVESSLAALKTHGYEARIYPIGEPKRPEDDEVERVLDLLGGGNVLAKSMIEYRGDELNDIHDTLFAAIAARDALAGLPDALPGQCRHCGEYRSTAPTEGAIPREATETMLDAGYQACDDFVDEHGADDDGATAANLDDGQWRDMLAVAYRAMWDAAPKATEGAAMEALRELVALNDSPLPAACDLDRHMRAWAAARAILASPIAPIAGGTASVPYGIQAWPIAAPAEQKDGK